MRACVAGTGSFLPPDVLTNADLTRIVDTSDEWIVSHTGIRERRVAKTMSTVDLGVYAAQAALANAALTPAEVDMVIVSTTTPDRSFPSVACDVQNRLGIGDAVCMDLAAGCTGFIYAADVAVRYIATGGARTVLLISPERLTPVVDYTDRSSCILFGDGAGAVVFRARDDDAQGGWLASYLSARGDGGASLRHSSKGKLLMDGHEVFRFAVRVMPEAMDRCLEAARLTVADLKFVIPHQANGRIVDAVMRRYNLAPEQVVSTVEKYGNSSSSGIPIALDELNRAGRLSPGDNVLFVGFGAGLTFGALLIQWGARGSLHGWDVKTPQPCTDNNTL